MALLKYFKPAQGLPDPRGSLSSSVPTTMINSMNAAVEEESRRVAKQRSPYTRYDPKLRAAIGQRACQHGVAAAARYFSRKLNTNVSQSSVRSIRDAYKKKVKETGEVTILHEKRRGRRVLLGADLDEKVQLYLKKVREGGGVVTARIAMAAAKGILMSSNRGALVEFGGHIAITKSWAFSLLKRMDFVQRKCTTSKSKHSLSHFKELKESFLADVVTTAKFEDIPPELILNLDQTGIKIVPSSGWTLAKVGSQRVEVIGANDKRQITAVFCGSMIGDFLPLQLIYGGKTNRCHPKFQFPLDWDITHSKKHWSNEDTMICYFENILVPYIRKTRELINVSDSSPALLIMDNFKGQVMPSIFDLLERHNIHTCLLPANTTDLLQPFDVAVNKPAKDFLRRKFQEWYSEQISDQLQDGQELSSFELDPITLGLPMMKEAVAGWLVEMFQYFQENPQIIVNGFLRTGICKALDSNNGSEDNDYTDASDSESEFDDETQYAESTDEADPCRVINL